MPIFLKVIDAYAILELKKQNMYTCICNSFYCEMHYVVKL